MRPPDAEETDAVARGLARDAADREEVGSKRNSIVKG